MINKIKNQKYPIKFLLSRIFWYSGICRIFIIHLPTGVKIRFYPTSASASFWIDPYCSIDDGYFISNYLSAGDTFIDVGANIGYLTLTGAKKVGTSGQVIAIEPHPRIFKFLNKNINLNRFDNVKSYNSAIGNESGVLRLSDSKSDEQNFVTGKGSIEVKMSRIDDVFQGNSVELLKIDTEGYELFVLKGALNTLLKTKLIFLESYQTHFDRYKYDRKDILNLLKDHNFRVFRLLSKNKLQEIDGGVNLMEFENLVAVSDMDFLRSRLKDLTIIKA